MSAENKAVWMRRIKPESAPEFETLWALKEQNAISQATFEQRALDLIFPSQNSAMEIAKHLAEANRHTIEPWRVEFDASTARWVAAQSGATGKTQKEELLEAREKFFVKARSRSLSIEEAMMGSYLCLLDDTVVCRRLMYHLLFEVSTEERITQHNWFMLNEYADAERAGIAKKVSQLRVPLFPPIGQLKALNEQILAEKGLLVGGGEDDRQAALAINKFYRASTDLRGGDYYEAVINEKGEQVSAVRMAGTDARLNHINNEVAALRSDIGRINASLSRPAAQTAAGRGRGTGRAYATQPPQGRAYQPYQAPARGRAPGAAGYRGGDVDEEGKNF